MKALSLSGHKIMFVAVLICLTAAWSISVSAVVQKQTGKAVNTVTVVTENELSFIGSTSFQNVANATVKVTVPAGKIQLVRAEFSADSSCQGSFAENFCQVKILADAVEMTPVSGGDFAFDGVGNADDFFEARAMQGSILLGPGTHIIQVKAAVTLAGMSFFFDDWSLTVTQYNNGK